MKLLIFQLIYINFSERRMIEWEKLPGIVTVISNKLKNSMYLGFFVDLDLILTSAFCVTNINREYIKILKYKKNGYVSNNIYKNIKFENFDILEIDDCKIDSKLDVSNNYLKIKSTNHLIMELKIKVNFF